MTTAAERPRIEPGTRKEIGFVNAGITRAIGAGAGSSRPPNLFTTLARHRRLFRRWLRFASGLMPGGKLPRIDSELLILRVAANTGCAYERAHHVRLGRAAGLSHEQIERVESGPGADGWSPRQELLLRAADELHEGGRISPPLWDELSPILSEEQLIELCMLVGHYEMLAMTINSIGIETDELGRASRTMRFLQRRLRR